MAFTYFIPVILPITIAIEKTDGEAVASQVFTPTVNIGGKASNKFSGVKVQTFEFDIPETDDYVLVFYTDDAKNADFILSLANIQANEFTETSIKGIDNLNIDNLQFEKGCFDLSGRRIDESKISNGSLKPGLYIINHRKVIIK